MYRCTTWERAKGPYQSYRRREPQKSALYKVVSTYREVLPRVWEERCQALYGALRAEITVALDEFLSCGLLSHGAARVYCDNCRHSFFVAFSCKRRGLCPSCSAKRAVMFAEHLFSEVLAAVPHRHIIFTIPKRLRVYPRYDRRNLGLLFAAAWGAVKELLGSDAGVPGLVLTVQTSGDALNFHPHLHGCLADGLFHSDGGLVPFGNMNEEALNRRFGELCVSGFLKQGLIEESDAAQILSQEHTGFSVWLGESFQDSESSKFVARYIERGPLSLERLAVTETSVVYTTKGGEQHTYDPLDFLALLCSHVPRPYESLTRFYGVYSSRVRGEQKKAEQRRQEETGQGSVAPEEEAPTKASSSWAACIKRVYEINPLECPKCKATMRVIAFVTDEKALARIMKSQGIPEQKPPKPMATGPPREAETFDPGPEYW